MGRTGMKMLTTFIHARSERLFCWALACAILVGLIASFWVPQFAVQAQDSETQVYTVLAGGNAAYNTTVLAFAPQQIQVHRGDTVSWIIDGFHNIHFAQGPTELVIMPEVNGQPMPQINPAVAFPSAESGTTYQGGDANSGLPLDPTTPMVAFSLVMDIEPGSYSYYCDVHPGMAGTIEVIDDITVVLSPNEVLVAGATELAASGGQGIQAALQATTQTPAETEDGGLQVQAGLQEGTTAVLDFFPSIAVIEAGQSVSWNVALGMEPHTVTWPTLPPGSEVSVIPQDAGAPILAFSEAAFPSVESGGEIGNGNDFNSGIMFPGQNYTLRFMEPGVYSYVCFLHPGMQGSVVVMPAT
jgi:plastocyanin